MASMRAFYNAKGPCKFRPEGCMDVLKCTCRENRFKQFAATLKTRAEISRCNLLLLHCWQDSCGTLRNAAGKERWAHFCQLLCIQRECVDSLACLSLSHFEVDMILPRSRHLMTTLGVIFLVLCSCCSIIAFSYAGKELWIFIQSSTLGLFHVFSHHRI